MIDSVISPRCLTSMAGAGPAGPAGAASGMSDIGPSLFRGKPGVGGGGGIDRHFGAEARSQRGRALGIVQPDPHRHALRHLHPVAGGVLGGQQRELGPSARADGLDRAGKGLAGGGVEDDFGALALREIGQLGFLEVRLDPGIAGLDQRKDRLAGRQHHALMKGCGLIDQPVRRRDDAGDREVVAGAVQLGQGGADGGMVVGRSLRIAAKRGPGSLGGQSHHLGLFAGLSAGMAGLVQRTGRGHALAGQRLLAGKLVGLIAGIVLGQCGLRLGLGQGGLQLLHLQPRRVHRGFGLGNGKFIGLRIDLEQQFPGLHRLQLMHIHRDHAPPDGRRDGNPGLVQIGVLGAFPVGAGQPPAADARNQQDRDRKHQKRLAQGTGGFGRGGRGGIGGRHGSSGFGGGGAGIHVRVSSLVGRASGFLPAPGPGSGAFRLSMIFTSAA